MCLLAAQLSETGSCGAAGPRGQVGHDVGGQVGRGHQPGPDRRSTRVCHPRREGAGQPVSSLLGGLFGGEPGVARLFPPRLRLLCLCLGSALLGRGLLGLGGRRLDDGDRGSPAGDLGEPLDERIAEAAEEVSYRLGGSAWRGRVLGLVHRVLGCLTVYPGGAGRLGLAGEVGGHQAGGAGRERPLAVGHESA